MKTEIEVKFTDVDIDEIRERLKKLGAVCEQPMRLMRRVLIDTEAMDKENKYLRIRDEGHEVTMTLKQHVEQALGGAREIETTVGDFDAAIAIFKEFDLHHRTYQESKREMWRYNGVEIVIDEWPWINPYIEIEGETEEAVRSAAAELGFDWSDAMFGSVDVIYQRDYPDMTVRGIIDVKEGHFGDPVPKEFGERASGT